MTTVWTVLTDGYLNSIFEDRADAIDFARTMHNPDDGHPLEFKDHPGDWLQCKDCGKSVCEWFVL